MTISRIKLHRGSNEVGVWFECTVSSGTSPRVSKLSRRDTYHWEIIWVVITWPWIDLDTNRIIKGIEHDIAVDDFILEIGGDDNEIYE